MMRKLTWLWVAALGIPFLACTGTVSPVGEQTPSGTGGGGTGTGGTVGTGGTSSTGGTSNTGGTVTDGGPDGSKVCGGLGGGQCAATEFCDWSDGEMCGATDGQGVCAVRPKLSECPVYDHCPMACGCDGVAYCDECQAHAAGVDVTGGTECIDAGPSDGGPDSGKACGGIGGLPCAADEYCDYGLQDMCGGMDGLGVCKTRPAFSDCPEYFVCPGACGCDGAWYCDECQANASGIDITGGSECMADSGPDSGPGIQYRAQAWFGGLDHVVLFKADTVRDTCTTVSLAGPMNPPSGGITMPQGWGIQSIVISNKAQDCGASPGNPPGQTVLYSSGKGAITFPGPDGGVIPCAISANLQLTFANAPAWVLAVETVDAIDIPVDGCQ